LRNFYFKELGNFFGIKYESDGKTNKFSSTIYARLFNDKRASQDNAIQRAKKLYNDQKDKAYHKQNPVTTVYQLVENLNANLRR
jgi:phosphoglycolate phosphatase-like HAD superfamily hydrolase